MRKVIFITILSFFITSCEDVIDVDVPTAPPRLVIDAGINWIKNTSGNEQFIKLTLSAPYFDAEIPPANGAQVSVTDSKSNTFNFVEQGSTGIYINNNFIPEIDAEYNLTINYQNEVYTATETLKSVSSVDFIEQQNDGGFTGDEIEIKAFYTDPKNEENFYFYRFTNTTEPDISLEVYDDEFTDGNQIFAFYTDEDLAQGHELIIRNFGISEQFYEFMFILQQQTGDNGGGPFETQPATVRGNCINQTNPENYPFGYFRVSEADEFIYIVQ
jgi:hypothetical protein